MAGAAQYSSSAVRFNGQQQQNPQSHRGEVKVGPRKAAHAPAKPIQRGAGWNRASNKQAPGQTGEVRSAKTGTEITEKSCRDTQRRWETSRERLKHSSETRLMTDRWNKYKKEIVLCFAGSHLQK